MLKVAVVHDWLVEYSGAERVLEQLLKMFPNADLLAVVDFLPDDLRHFIQQKPVKTTFIQAFPLARTRYRYYLPLNPLAIEQLDLSEYELILSSSHAVSKGVLTGPDQLHISYGHTPIRCAWDLQHQYLKESGLKRGLKGWLARWILHKIRIRTANGVDALVANSRFIAQRIRKTYRRKAAVVYPPDDVARFTLQEQKYNFTSRRLEWRVQGGKPCYIQVEQSARNKTMRSRRESYKYRRRFMMAPDQWRIQQGGQWAYSCPAFVQGCTKLPIYGLTIGVSNEN